MPKTYGHLKTNIDVKDLLPQIETLKSHGVTDENLYSDPTVAGKTYPGLNALLGKLKRKDALVVPHNRCPRLLARRNPCNLERRHRR